MANLRQCAWCLLVMDRRGTYTLEPGRKIKSATHGICPKCKDQVRAEIPLDGLEVYHPSHGPEIINTYQEYVRKHNLLLSTGSDSHSIPCRMPIKYRAEISRELLERVGIQVGT